MENLQDVNLTAGKYYGGIHSADGISEYDVLDSIEKLLSSTENHGKAIRMMVEGIRSLRSQQKNDGARIKNLEEDIEKMATKKDIEQTVEKFTEEKTKNIVKECLLTKIKNDDRLKEFKLLGQRKASEAITEVPDNYERWEEPDFFKAICQRIWGMVRRRFNYSGLPSNLNPIFDEEAKKYIKTISNEEINYPLKKK